MNTLISDLLRSSVSAVMNVLLLFSLAKPRYGKRCMNLAMVTIIVLDVVSSVFFYLNRDLTSLAKFDFLLYIVLYIAAKPLFLDNLMQWLFNFITVMNIYIAVMILSYDFCDYLPYPNYANTLLRFLLFALVIILFRFRLRPLYQQATAHWNVFFLIATGILINFIYYFYFTSNIITTLDEQEVPLLLLILLAVFAYSSIFYSLRTISAEYELREENIRSQARVELLQSEYSSYEKHLDISRQYHHDLRHHNALLTEMLTDKDIDAALEYLKQYDDSIMGAELRQYCKHPVANAIFRLYEHHAQTDHIAFTVNTDIPNTLPLAGPELGGLLSNLLENAWNANKSCEATGRFISVTADTTDSQLFLEVKNSVAGEVQFIDGLPVSKKEGGGMGTRSIKRIVTAKGGMWHFKQDRSEFIVQIVLPLR